MTALLPISAGAQADATVTIVDAMTYDIDQPFPSTFCFDGDAQNLEVGDIVGPESVEPGTYLLEIYFGPDEACGGQSPDFADDFTFAAGDDVTLMLFWVQGEQQTEIGISVLDNDLSCVEPGTGRLTLRHGSAADTVDLESDGTALIEGVDPTEQGAVDLDAGDYPDSEIVEAGSGTPVADLGTLTIEEGQSLIVYLAGGIDGDIGTFTDTVDLDVCGEPTTTTTMPPVAPVAPVAAAVAVTPAFTG
jgi:hypothetical protein